MKATNTSGWIVCIALGFLIMLAFEYVGAAVQTSAPHEAGAVLCLLFSPLLWLGGTFLVYALSVDFLKHHSHSHQ